MIYPLENWSSIRRGYRFGSQTTYSKFHLGVDYLISQGTKIYAPTDGEILRRFFGSEGGNTIWFRDDTGKLIRFLHNSSFVAQVGKIKQGTVLALSDNTGLSSAPHSHIDVSKNGKLEINNIKNFIDPDKYFVNTPMPIPTGKVGKENVPAFFNNYIASKSNEQDNIIWGEKTSVELIRYLCEGTAYKAAIKRYFESITGSDASQEDYANFIKYRFPQYQIIDKAIERAGK